MRTSAEGPRPYGRGLFVLFYVVGVLGGKPLKRKSFRAVPPFFVFIRQATLTHIITIMKALRYFFLFLLAAFSFVASAQTIEVYKDGRVIDSFSATQVDSIVYAPAAAQPRYYYYAGWDCPTTVEAEMKRLLSNQGCGNAVEIVDFDPTLEKYTYENPLVNYQQNPINSPDDPNDRLYLEDEQQYYIMVPKGLNIYNYARICINSVYTSSELTYDNVVYTVYKSKQTGFDIMSQIIYK